MNAKKYRAILVKNPDIGPMDHMLVWMFYFTKTMTRRIPHSKQLIYLLKWWNMHKWMSGHEMNQKKMTENPRLMPIADFMREETFTLLFTADTYKI